MKVDDSFTDFVFKILADQRSQYSPETYYTYRSAATKLLRFRPSVRFSELNEIFIGEYRQWMLRNGNNENTASKTLRTLRTWVNQAIRYEHLSKNPFQYVRIKKVDGKREFLKISEFNTLFEFYSGGTMRNIDRVVLRHFLFSCATGLRYGDIKRLKWDDIEDEMLRLTMHKTQLPVSIPISDKAKVLLGERSKGSVFRVYCNKVTNRILKSVIKSAGINKRVTFHVARHSFATISITLGIPLEVVSKLLGHTDLKTTQIYARVVDSVKVREMSKWNSL
jgi:integrase/recombinase XerC